MNREEFEAAFDTDVKTFDQLLREAAQNGPPGWDVDNPMFFGLLPADDGYDRGIILLKDKDGNNLEKQEAMEAFRNALQDLGAVAGSILCGGYALDPETRERVGEVLLLTMEDRDDHFGHAKWELARNDLAPVTLGKVESHVSDNASECTGGAMQGFFPQPRPKHKLN